MPRSYVFRIAFPTLLTASLIVVAIFVVLLPALENSILERKREMIRELTNSAWNVLANFEQEVKQGRLSRTEAEAEAIRQIQNLHYGDQMKDYFWINDMHPRMVTHPYRRDLIGKDLSDFRDPTGKRLFVEFVDRVKRAGSGYVEYRWQWKDDPTLVVPKLSFVKGFEPWGWVIGTGVYLDDVESEIRQVTRRLVFWSVVIVALVALLQTVIARQSWMSERLRVAAQWALQESEERYRTLVESAGESIIMALEGEPIYANAQATTLLGYSTDSLSKLRLSDLFADEASSPGLGGSKPTEAGRHELSLRRSDGTCVHVLASSSPVRLGARAGWILVATDITAEKRAEHDRGRSEARLLAEVSTLRDRDAEREASLSELRSTLALLHPSSTESAHLGMLDRVRSAETIEDLSLHNRALPGVIRSMVDSGASAALVTRLISLNTDAVLERVIGLCQEDMGPPPAPFSFLVMGSQARREQTLITDQDNAIVFEEVSASEQERMRVKTYFRTMGARVCEQLASVGYTKCEHGVMAMNPDLCQPVTAFKGLFRRWIESLEPDDLLNAKIMFDFRNGHGSPRIADELRAALFEELDAQPRFFAQLARDVLEYTPSVGVFGQLQVETGLDGRKIFNLKSALVPIVDFARLYALRHHVESPSTIERLEALRAGDVITSENFRAMREVFEALMHIRLQAQVHRVAEGHSPDSGVVLTSLTKFEQRMLKESLAEIRNFQTRLRYDFTGMPEVPA